MKTLGGEQYVVTKAYKFATFEILRFLVSETLEVFVLHMYVSTQMLNNYSNFNSMVQKCPKSKVLLSYCGTLYSHKVSARDGS